MASDRPEIRRRRRILWLLLALPAVWSCSTGDRMLFVADTYFDAAYLDGAEAKRLSRVVSSLDMRLTTRTLAPDTTSEAFIDLISRNDAEFIVVTPFAARLAAAAAPVYPDRRFLIVYGDTIAPQGNLQRLATDRTAAYHDVGVLSRRVLDSLGGDRRMLVLAYVGDERRTRELETFLEGYDAGTTVEARAVVEPEIHRFNSLEDGRAAARTASEISGDFDLVLVSLASMNADVLSALSSSNGPYVITEGFGQVPDGDLVVGLIVEDWIEGVAEAVDSRNPRVFIPCSVVPGPGWPKLGISDAAFGTAEGGGTATKNGG